MQTKPFQLAHGVSDEFLPSQFCAFPWSTPDPHGQGRTHLERRSSLGIPLARGKFVWLSVETLAGRVLLPLSADTESKRKWAKESLGNLMPVKPKQSRRI